MLCLLHLNTSHVLIYQVCFEYAAEPTGFKYISCSYLSTAVPRRNRTDFKFKYISCSYLSNTASNLGTGLTYLNTSHVLIYPVYDKCAFIVHHNLNTSHVLIYHLPSFTEESLPADLNTSHVLIYQDEAI